MCKRFTLATMLVVASVFAVAGQVEDLKAGGVITKFGHYKALEGKLAVKVSEADGKLSVGISPSSKPDTTFSLILPSEKGAFWLVYPEAINKVWFFRDSDLLEWEVTKTGTTTRAWAGKEVPKAAPKALLDSLPKGVLDRLKGK